MADKTTTTWRQLELGAAGREILRTKVFEQRTTGSKLLAELIASIAAEKVTQLSYDLASDPGGAEEEGIEGRKRSKALVTDDVWFKAKAKASGMGTNVSALVRGMLVRR